MVVERISRIATDVITAVKRQFGDTSGVQVNDAHIFAWINDAQREIVKENPELKQTLVQLNVISGTATYALLTAIPDILIVHSIHYRGHILQNMSFVEAQEYIIRNDTAFPQPSGEPVIWYEYAGTLTLWPTPQTSYTNGLTVYYSEVPVAVSAVGNSLDLPDSYFNTTVSYCMWKAYEMDENFSAAQQMMQQFGESVTRLSNRTRSEDNRYPTITLLPEDNLYG